METSFYTRLLFSTIAPMLITLLIFLYMFIARAFTAKERVLRRKEIRNNCIEAFLGLTYLVFASVSTTIFEVRICKSVTPLAISASCLGATWSTH